MILRHEYTWISSWRHFAPNVKNFLNRPAVSAILAHLIDGLEKNFKEKIFLQKNDFFWGCLHQTKLKKKWGKIVKINAH